LRAVFFLGVGCRQEELLAMLAATQPREQSIRPEAGQAKVHKNPQVREMWDECQGVALKHPEIEGIIGARRAAGGDPQSDIGQLLLDSFQQPAKVLVQPRWGKKLGEYFFLCREARRIPISLGI
jgi:hypothetical protein